jgi:hypothetical protein
MVTYHHTLTNTGSTTDTYLLEALSTQEWPVALSEGGEPATTLTLQVGASMTTAFQVHLTVPLEIAGVTDVTFITATSQLDPAAYDAVEDTTVVANLVYLPILANRWPPLPYPPKLNPIENADGDGFYSVTWAAADLADTYSLEEDTSADFSDPSEVYAGAGSAWSVPNPGKTPGTYYYRVRGHNSWGYGEYSNVEAATAQPFRADDTSLSAGQCTMLRWQFDNIKALYISFGYGYDKEGVPGHGTREVCPSVTTTYEALAVKDGADETHQVTIDVSGTGCGDPVIKAFYANTYNVRPGEQFGIAWNVECAKTVHLIIGGGPEEPVAGEGSKDVRIYTTTVFTLKVQKSDGNFVYRTFTVYVSS